MVMLLDESLGLWVMAPLSFRCATLINIENKGNVRMQVAMVTVSYFKYVRMKLFSYSMRS